jgi:hypothetical protein
MPDIYGEFMRPLANFVRFCRIFTSIMQNGFNIIKPAFAKPHSVRNGQAVHASKRAAKRASKRQ